MYEIRVITLCRGCDSMFEGSNLTLQCPNCGYKLDLAVDASDIIEVFDNED